MRQERSRRRERQRGSSLIEFSTVALVLIMFLFSIVEMYRMLLVISALADSARAGVRYAIVHGANNPPVTPVSTVVSNMASTGILNTSRLNINVAYSACDSDPGSGCATSPFKAPGSKVSISVSYPYDPFTTYFPLSVNLGSSSQGVITY